METVLKRAGLPKRDSGCHSSNLDNEPAEGCPLLPAEGMASKLSFHGSSAWRFYNIPQPQVIPYRRPAPTLPRHEQASLWEWRPMLDPLLEWNPRPCSRCPGKPPCERMRDWGPQATHPADPGFVISSPSMKPLP